MSLKSINCITVTVTMSLLSLALFIIILMLTTVKADIQNNNPPSSSVQNFKVFVANMIKEQSSKIQTLLKKIQTNAQSVLEKIDNMKQDTKLNKRKLDIKTNSGRDGHQIESPVLKSNELIDTSVDAIAESRNFNNHYGSSGYGVSGNANYGAPTYHHHSIGFDPINIVVSMSLLSFLLQALQGLLGRTRLPTPVVEARTLNPIQAWTKKFEENLADKNKDQYYMKKKYFKKYFRK